MARKIEDHSGAEQQCGRGGGRGRGEENRKQDNNQMLHDHCQHHLLKPLFEVILRLHPTNQK